jgi:hypothetical protein
MDLRKHVDERATMTDGGDTYWCSQCFWSGEIETDWEAEYRRIRESPVETTDVDFCPVCGSSGLSEDNDE